MTAIASPEEIAAANAYEQLHVPALFRQWAPRVAEAARIRPGQRVLDVACGTGILAREVALRLGGEGMVAGVDPSGGYADRGHASPQIRAVLHDGSHQPGVIAWWRRGSAPRMNSPNCSAWLFPIGKSFFSTNQGILVPKGGFVKPSFGEYRRVS